MKDIRAEQEHAGRSLLAWYFPCRMRGVFYVRLFKESRAAQD